MALSIFWSGVTAAEEADERSIATPLRIVNLNPFHMLYGVPSSFGTPVLAPGSTELIASMDIASHLRGGVSDREVVAIDGETHTDKRYPCAKDLGTAGSICWTFPSYRTGPAASIASSRSGTEPSACLRATDSLSHVTA